LILRGNFLIIVKLSWNRRHLIPPGDGCWWRKDGTIKGATDKMVTVKIVAGICELDWSRLSVLKLKKIWITSPPYK
jgi:hypothetical protein